MANKQALEVLRILDAAVLCNDGARLALVAALRRMIAEDWTAQAISAAWARTATGGTTNRRCIRMAYEAAQTPDGTNLDEIADRMITLAGPRRRRK